MWAQMVWPIIRGELVEDRSSGYEMPDPPRPSYPDWRPGETMMVSRRVGPDGEYRSVDAAREAVAVKHGRIYEEHEVGEMAYFRVRRPQ